MGGNERYLKLLNESYEEARGYNPSMEMTRSEFLSDYVFDFTLYDGDKDSLFARIALDVCIVISLSKTFDYQRIDDDHYTWYLIMVNMPFFQGKLDWGTSIRGAWWTHDEDKLCVQSCGMWVDGEQETDPIVFERDDWIKFVFAMDDFVSEEKRSDD